MALVFNRKPGQALYIGDHIEIEVVETHRSWVSLRVKAPADMTILRAELVGRTPNPARPAPQVFKARPRQR